MAKKTLKIFTLLIILISAPLILFGCKKEPNVLIKPYTIGLVLNDVYDTTTEEYVKTEVLLVTDENSKATKYRFFVTDNSDYENINNYVSIYSDHNYLDISNYFNEEKTYYYFVQYIGNKNYINSEYSDIKSYSPEFQTKVDTPYLQMVDTTLNWFRIQNAQKYEIYEKKVDKNGNVFQDYTKISEVGGDAFLSHLNSHLNYEDVPYYKHYYKIKAIASGRYLTSEFSNEVSYKKDITLSVPTNVRVIKEGNAETGDKYYLTWNEVKYANEYSVIINGNSANKIKTNTNRLDITDVLTTYTSYNFSVNASGSEAVSFTPSQFTAPLNYDYTYTLNAPTNLNIDRNGNNIDISWESVADAHGYTLIIEYNNKKVIEETNVEQTSALIAIKDIVSNLTSNAQIKVKVKANGLAPYILDSKFTEKTYTIIATKLDTPTNINVIKEDNKFYLTFDTVNNASVYIVTINGDNDNKIEITTNKLEITQFLLEEGDYTFSIVATNPHTATSINSNVGEFVYTYSTPKTE